MLGKGLPASTNREKFRKSCDVLCKALNSSFVWEIESLLRTTCENKLGNYLPKKTGKHFCFFFIVLVFGRGPGFWIQSWPWGWFVTQHLWSGWASVLVIHFRSAKKVVEKELKKRAHFVFWLANKKVSRKNICNYFPRVIITCAFLFLAGSLMILVRKSSSRLVQSQLRTFTILPKAPPSQDDINVMHLELEELRRDAKLLTHKRFSARFRETTKRIGFLEERLEGMGETVNEDEWLANYKPDWR